ncbi:MAG TPA: hypothetical protein VL155_14280 [Terriglobales bacterium]|jgi:hypothetical protein|nr:hypothetical protein [Terriglobales bacterium]
MAAPAFSLREVVESLQSADGHLPREVEERFFAFLRLHNGTAKTTYPHRLDEVNGAAASLLPPWRPLQLLDVGVSSGVSTLEWIESLERSGVELHMTAMDLMVRGILIGFGHGVEILADARGRALLINIRGSWIPNPAGRRNLLRYFAVILALRLWLRLFWPRVMRSVEGNLPSRWFTTCWVPLLHSALVNHPGVSIQEADILGETMPMAHAHVIRAANILNRSYFSDAQLAMIVRRLRARLPSGGLLIVCRTYEDSGVTAGTIFQLHSTGCFQVAARINNGSEIENLICQLEPYTPASRPCATPAEA